MGAIKPMEAFMKPTPTGITSAEAVNTKKAVNMASNPLLFTVLKAMKAVKTLMAV
jgi:hypothetical protein